MKLLAFSPHSGIDLHARPEGFLLQALAVEGWGIDIVNCDGLLSSYCSVMASIGLSENSSDFSRSAVCVGCRRRRNKINSKKTGQVFMSLEKYTKAADFELWEKISAGVSPDNWLDTEIMGIPVGRYAAYEFILTHKIQDSRMPPTLLSGFKYYLRSVVLTLPAASRILDDRAPDRVLVYNSLYGVNRVWNDLAARRGIPCYSIHGGANDKRRYDSLMMYRDDAKLISIARSAQAYDAMEKPARLHELKAVSEHLMGKLFEAADTFTYSAPYSNRHPAEIRHRFKLERGKPVFLVALSSPDERRAAEISGLRLPEVGKPNFDSQFDWLAFLIEIADQRQDWRFIFRVHPRMYPNHREGQLSPDAARIETLLSSAPKNVHVNLPSDHLSLLDLFSVVDVGITRTSTVGLEMAALGYPVILADPATYFAGPQGAFLTPEKAGEHVNVMDLAVAQGFRAEPMICAYRYLSFLHFQVARKVPWRSIPPSARRANRRRDPKRRSLVDIRKKFRTNGLDNNLRIVKYLLSDVARDVRPGVKNPFEETGQDWLAPFAEVLHQRLDGLHEASRVHVDVREEVRNPASTIDEITFHWMNTTSMAQRMMRPRTGNCLVVGLDKVKVQLESGLLECQKQL